MVGPTFKDRYLDDYVVGEVVTFGEIAVTKNDIVTFALQFDPQPFHVDETAAKASIFGGLVASGWHTACLMMRMMVDDFTSIHSTGSSGIDELRWLKPVRPGDTLSCRLTIVDVRPSLSRADRGAITQQVEVINGHGETVMTCTGKGFLMRRPGMG
jgi:acyl dehydratase